jgi:NifU-like protein involved in Fe-S cluster formation
VLRPAKDYRNRHASILLTLEALSEAMEKIDCSDCA